MTIVRPRLAVMPGDPAGVGPELLARLLADPSVHEEADVVVVGDRHVLAAGEAAAGIALDLAPVDKPEDVLPGHLKWVPMDTIAAADVRRGEVAADHGRSALLQLGQCLDLVRSEAVDGFLFAPMNKAALKAAGMNAPDELRWLAGQLDVDCDCGEINALDGLWSSRVTSHVPIREVAGLIDEAGILRAIRLLATMLRRAGIDRPEIAVCGLNPHAGDHGTIGREEVDIIAPAITKAVLDGFAANGPYPADTVFVRAREGGIDGIVTMYHDQGQIAMKLMGFARGVTILGGLPIPVTTPAHGTAFDIAGQGVADPRAIRAAFSTLVALAGTVAA